MGSGPARSVLTEVLSPRDAGAEADLRSGNHSLRRRPTLLKTSRRTRNASVTAQPTPANNEKAAAPGCRARTCAPIQAKHPGPSAPRTHIANGRHGSVTSRTDAEKRHEGGGGGERQRNIVNKHACAWSDNSSRAGERHATPRNAGSSDARALTAKRPDAAHVRQSQKNRCKHRAGLDLISLRASGAKCPGQIALTKCWQAHSLVERGECASSTPLWGGRPSTVLGRRRNDKQS